MTKDGRRLDVALTISPVRDDSGTIIGASKIVPRHHGPQAGGSGADALLRENARSRETLNNVGAIVASDLDRDKVVQAVTDAATELTTAEFGAFFYNVVNESGESYTLYTISGRAARGVREVSDAAEYRSVRGRPSKGPAWFEARTLRRIHGTVTMRRTYGMPRGHLPVRSYLAVPVKGRSGDVIGGLFFGHPAVGRFTRASSSGWRWASRRGPRSRSRMPGCTRASRRPAASRMIFWPACRMSCGRR